MSSAPATFEYGLAHVQRGFRTQVKPFVEYREITKGRQKGYYEITALGRKYIVHPKHIVRFPGELDKQVKKKVKKECLS